MWIRVRTIDGLTTQVIHDLSRLCKIEDLRKKIEELFHVEAKRQQLYYGGKLFVDDHTLFDYNVKDNDVIQLSIRPENLAAEISNGYETTESNGLGSEEIEAVMNEDTLPLEEPDEEVPFSNYYKVGDFIDAKEDDSGSWFEAKIVKMIKQNSTDEGFHSRMSFVEESTKEELHKNEPVGETFSPDMDSEYAYYVLYDGYEDDPPPKLKFQNIRPRSYKTVKPNQVKVGDVLMVSYNFDKPDKRGFWYDACVTNVEINNNKTSVKATILIGCTNTPIENCVIRFVDEMFQIETCVELDRRSAEMEQRMQARPPPKRLAKPNCEYCEDNARKKCRECACKVCGLKKSPEKQIICDECQDAYHLWCLKPPLETVPEDDWFCPNCKLDTNEVVQKGEKLKISKRKAKLPSSQGTCKRDWGKGMACAKSRKTCTIVPSTHLGPIPNVYVGTSWKFRIQVLECGVHRSLVGGIHGSATEGNAYSVVMSGGYEDDHDEGDEFTYTGSGGRDLTGNKRTSFQSCDQKLTSYNLSLAMNCNAPVNKIKGAEAKNWKAGKPVRVVRSAKSKKHSKYGPEEGQRYDGIYKVVKYWPETGKSGFLVWRYLLRRDDPEPAPWTKAGKELAEQRGLKLIYPEGYVETPKGSKNSKNKRKLEEELNTSSEKKRKVDLLPVPDPILKMIKTDTKNKNLWDECVEFADKGIAEFVKKVEEVFMCTCCRDVVCIPITTKCGHNCCQECLRRSFDAKCFTCPSCRSELGIKLSSLRKNDILRKVLQELLPGYENGR